MFADRRDAGRRLGERLAALNLSNPVVLGLPRGGVTVGYEVARRTGAPLEVFVVRKIGHPRQPEFGVGAIAEGGEPVLDMPLLARLGLDVSALDATIAAERRELARRVHAYRGDRQLPELGGRTAVVVDDGLATGGSARAALRALRALPSSAPARLVLAVPVGAADTATAMAAEADDVVVLVMPESMRAIGGWYADFGQVSDAEVVRLLATAPRSTSS